MADKTLCKLIKKDVLDEKFEDYAALVKEPQYICRKCGRAAAKKKHLCKAQSID